MMAGRSPDSMPYEMIRDAAESVKGAHDAIHAIALDMSTAKSEREILFRHVDAMRDDIKRLDKAVRGNGSSQGLRARVDAMEKRQESTVELAKVRWWAIGTIGMAIGSVALHFI